MKTKFEKNGFVTFPFSNSLRVEMLHYIYASMHELLEQADGHTFEQTIKCNLGTLEPSEAIYAKTEILEPFQGAAFQELAQKIPDGLWQDKMSRCFRIFPEKLSNKILLWAHENFCKPFGKTQSAVNVVLPDEATRNPKITENHLAIYWRCVRSNKPDAGRPHRDSSFWNLEFQEGYDPKVPFPFNYLKNCLKIWIPLYGCSKETSLRLIPGSHKMNIPTTVEQTEYGRRPSICPSWLKENNHLFISPAELSEGSCLIFDMDLVHVGPRHHQPDVRISAEFNFITL